MRNKNFEVQPDRLSNRSEMFLTTLLIEVNKDIRG